MGELIIRPATGADHADLRAAVVELQEQERRLNDSRLPGEAMADTYLAWMLGQASGGAVLVAEVDGAFAGFVAGWINEEAGLAETPDSSRYGLVSDLCVLPAFRKQRVAVCLLERLEAYFSCEGVLRVRLGVLAANTSARYAYERAGYEPYEIIYEKRVGH